MPENDECETLKRVPQTLSRRTVLIGAASTALVATLQPVGAAARLEKRREPPVLGASTGSGIQRYMAAAAALGDGRILIAGGYGKPWRAGETPRPLNSAIILDPSSGGWRAIAPMAVPRARHAAVLLRNGRVAVLGGIGIQPTASVEIYDPRTDTWSVGRSLAQARYDHTAVLDGSTIYLIGGSALSMLSSVEQYQPETELTVGY